MTATETRQVEAVVLGRGRAAREQCPTCGKRKVVCPTCRRCDDCAHHPACGNKAWSARRPAKPACTCMPEDETGRVATPSGSCPAHGWQVGRPLVEVL